MMKSVIEKHGFYKFILPFGPDLFTELSGSADFEDVAKGRKGNHLVDMREGRAPLVRTTTKYNIPANCFSGMHHQIVESIKNEANGSVAMPIDFNNALIEIYDHTYTKMKFHSDQSIDLAGDSFIALFSCYEQSDALPLSAIRKLKVKSKTSGEAFEFLLENNSVVLFSLETNTRYQHKIVLEPVKGAKPAEPGNRWLGITFRQSKTYIQFEEGQPRFSDGTILHLADEEQGKEFYRLRGMENESVDFVYPEMVYTLSPGDLLMPE